MVIKYKWKKTKSHEIYRSNNIHFPGTINYAYQTSKRIRKIDLKMNYTKVITITNTQYVKNVINYGTIIQAVNDYIYIYLEHSKKMTTKTKQQMYIDEPD